MRLTIVAVSAVLLIAIAAIAVADRNRGSLRLQQAKETLLRCETAGSAAGACDDKYILRRDGLTAGWRSHRNWYVFGAFSLIVLSGVGLYATRRPDGTDAAATYPVNG